MYLAATVRNKTLLQKWPLHFEKIVPCTERKRRKESGIWSGPNSNPTSSSGLSYFRSNALPSVPQFWHECYIFKLACQVKNSLTFWNTSGEPGVPFHSVVPHLVKFEHKKTFYVKDPWEMYLTGVKWTRNQTTREMSRSWKYAYFSFAF